MILDLLERRGNPLENPSVGYDDPAVWGWLGEGSKTSAGARIGHDSALTVPAYFAGVRFIAETIGSLPCKLYQRAGRAKEVLRNDPRHIRMNSVANENMTAGTVREAMQGHLCTWGNAYGWLDISPAGRLLGVWPLRPDRMQILATKDNRLAGYRYTLPSGAHEDFRVDEVLHIPGFGFDGVQGYSLVTLARETLGLAKASETSAAELFGNGILATGFASTPGELTKKTRESLRESIEAQARRRRGLLLLEGGVKYEQMGIPPGDAQFLESRQFSVVEIARWLDLPPHILKDLTHATYTNIEAQGLELITLSLRRWFVRWEQHLNKSLLTELERTNGLYFKIDDRALLRGDTAARGTWYSERFQLGSYSPNDIRELEDENEIEGGDQYFVNAAMIPLEQAVAMPMAQRLALIAAHAGVTEQQSATREDPARDWLRECWQRVVRGEIRELRKWHRKDDPPPLAEYYQGEFVDWSSGVLRSAFEAMGREDVRDVLEAYATDALQTLADVTPTQLEHLLADWLERADRWAARL